jgi:hypothetical protein
MAKKDNLPTGNEERTLRNLARASAHALRERDLFGERRLYVPELLKRLKLTLTKDDRLGARGMIKDDEIKVRGGRWSLDRRLVILHEVGHAVLKRDYPELAQDLPHRQQELFAMHFAANMLLDEKRRVTLIERFRCITSPAELADTAQRFRFPLAIFLQLATWDGETIIGPDKIWLRVKHAANRYTHRDPKLRIISAHFDPAYWYVPANKGFEGLAGESRWLLEIPIGVERHRSPVTFKLQKVAAKSARTKFQQVESVGRLSALSLRPVRGERGAHLLVMLSVA